MRIDLQAFVSHAVLHPRGKKNIQSSIRQRRRHSKTSKLCDCASFPQAMPKAPKLKAKSKGRIATTSSSKSKSNGTRPPAQPKFDYDLAYENLDLRERPEVKLVLLLLELEMLPRLN